MKTKKTRKKSKTCKKSDIRKKSPLMELPAELRTDIYELALIEQDAVEITDEYRQPSLLLVSKQLRFEAAPVFYGNNTFRFTRYNNEECRVDTGVVRAWAQAFNAHLHRIPRVQFRFCLNHQAYLEVRAPRGIKPSLHFSRESDEETEGEEAENTAAEEGQCIQAGLAVMEMANSPNSTLLLRDAGKQGFGLREYTRLCCIMESNDLHKPCANGKNTNSSTGGKIACSCSDCKPHDDKQRAGGRENSPIPMRLLPRPWKWCGTAAL